MDLTHLSSSCSKLFPVKSKQLTKTVDTNVRMLIFSIKLIPVTGI